MIPPEWRKPPDSNQFYGAIREIIFIRSKVRLCSGVSDTFLATDHEIR
jgi:hypothetical protein